MESISDFLDQRGLALQVSNPEAFHERTMECSLQWAARDIGDAAHIIRQHLFEKLAALPVSHRGYKLLLVLPDISWALATPPSELYRDAMRAFTFAPQIRELARNLAHRVREKGPYNAVHLRLEEDLTVSYKDGLHGLQSAYLATLAQAGYSAETPIYIASGLSKANDPDSRDAQVESWIQAEVVDTFASEAIAKEDFLSVELLSELTSEQRAALDCTMLVESNKFVGLTVSSMSYLVQELRKLRGFAPDTTNLIGDGNLDLYARTYTVKV